MSSFMEGIAGDIDEVFFDPDLFAHIHNVDGKDIPVIVDENELAEVIRKSQGRSNDRRDDIFKNETMLYLRKSDVGEKRLRINSVMKLDGKDLFVHDVKEEEGIYKVALGRYQV